jgi:hypothetical protein
METNFVAMEFLFLLADVILEELEKELNLFFGTLPVFGTEGIEGKPVNPPFSGAVKNSTDCLDSLAVSLNAGKPPNLSPATIPVHNKGDMARDLFPGEIEGRDLGGWVHRKSQSIKLL